MVKDEIFIGREVGKDDFIVDKKYITVGRKHARIIRKSDEIYIEDLNSSNGTFVNGKPVSLKKINTSDIITLGGINHYELPLEKVLNLLSVSNNEFQKKFLNLKHIYEDYQAESNNLQTKGMEDMITKRMLPTMLTGIFTGIFTAYIGYTAPVKIAIAICGGILTVVVFLIATKMASNSNKKTKEKMTQLNEKFELDYVCPDCGVSFRGKSWEFLKRAGKCHICKREFQIDIL